MNIDIREYIKKNFTGSSVEDIKQSIEESLSKKDDVTLPGLGCLFEVLWSSSSDEEKETILNHLSDSFK